MSIPSIAVVGVGYLGKFHAQKYVQLANAKLIAVVDTNTAGAQALARELGTEAIADYRDLLGRVDAVSIAVPTGLHYKIALDFLEQGSHILIEKPITSTVDQAQHLIKTARAKDLILQVGHLERFNPAIMDLAQFLTQPMFIESHRLAPFKPRGTDVSVVLDLMIHDIDIILNIVHSELSCIEASGTPVLSPEIDIANARLVFKNGCVANVTASRISMKSERKMRVFQSDAYLAVDFQNRLLTMYRKGIGEMYPGIPNIVSEERSYDESDALMTEIKLFVDAVRSGGEPIVSGEDGKRALATAIQISELLSSTAL